MDSPQIAIHVIMHNKLTLTQQESENPDNINKLHFALTQPVGRINNNINIDNMDRVPPPPPPIESNHDGHRNPMPPTSNNRPNSTSYRPSNSRTHHTSNSHNSTRRTNTHHNHNRITGSSSSHELSSTTSPVAGETPMRRLKKMGWYWGSISPGYASRLLENEQDGSFLIRDSSSECYIFSMSLKLNGEVHHARIEHSKGHFSFGHRSRKFFCTTIVDFIEQAIEYSQNGNLLFFLHRDPAYEGPVRFIMVPLSRMKGLTSLKHMCRFAILPYVRRDKINELTIPSCLMDYLNEPFQDLREQIEKS